MNDDDIKVIENALTGYCEDCISTDKKQQKKIDKIWKRIKNQIQEEKTGQREMAEEWAEDTNGEIITDSDLLKEIEDIIHDSFYYGQGWNRINGGFANVEVLEVVKYDDDGEIRYKVFTVVKHGEQDCGDGCAKTYTETTEFEMNEDLEVVSF